MPSIMVYTEETFYYTDGIRVVAREEYMRPDVTELSFYRKEGFWFGFEAPYSIYTMQGIRALIELKLTIVHRNFAIRVRKLNIVTVKKRFSIP